MRILGTSFYYHDSAAALVADGRLVAAAEEERFNRRKHSSEFPRHAIRYCLDAGGISPDRLDAVAFYEKPFLKFDRILRTCLATWPRSLATFVEAMPVWLGSRLRLAQDLDQALPGYAGDIFYSSHHLSHAASAFLPSPFDKAAVLVADGVGEWSTTSIGCGEGGDLRLDREIRFPHSIGLLYSAITAYLGFRVNDAEWKVMGLAPYGEPRFLAQMRKLVETRPDGSFRLDMEYFCHHWSHRRMFHPRLEALFGRPARRAAEPLDSFHSDIARSIQALIEEMLLAIARNLRERYDTGNLCLAGGVALNSVANWRLLKETGFKRIFIQPAAGDSGGALGCALLVGHTLFKEPRTFVMQHGCWGPEYPDGQIRQTLDALGVPYESLEEAALLDRTARMILANKVIGWFQGRMEFGPRALGSRSILGNATHPGMKEILNAKVKFREPFRPFAPSVLKEAAPRYFEMGDLADSPFMLLVVPVRPGMREKIPAVTHRDGTGRVQTLTEETNGRFYRLVRRVGELCGTPVVVNTSFNIRGEPIVNTPEDAVRCFEKTGIDALVLGSYVITAKRADADLAKGWAESDRLEGVPTEDHG